MRVCVCVYRVKLTEEDRKRLAMKKKEQASKLSWNDGDGEGVGMRIVVLKHVFHPDDARAAYNFYEEVARITVQLSSLCTCLLFFHKPLCLPLRSISIVVVSVCC